MENGKSAAQRYCCPRLLKASEDQRRTPEELRSGLNETTFHEILINSLQI